MSTRWNALVTYGTWAWLDFYDNDLAVLTYEIVFSVDPNYDTTKVYPEIKQDFAERGGIQYVVYKYEKTENQILMTGQDHFNEKNLTLLQKTNDELSFKSRKQKGPPYHDPYFSVRYPKFIKTTLTDTNTTDAIKVFPKGKRKEDLGKDDEE